MQKGFSPILILVSILIIVVVAGGAYFLGKSSIPKTTQPQNPIVTSQNLQPTINLKPTLTTQPLPTSISTPGQNGVDLEGIKYTLRPGWKAEITSDSLTGRSLRISPSTGVGLLVIHAYDYPNNIGRREYYCKVTNYCIEGTTYYTQVQIGNISGYEANTLDNSGGGSEYFGAKGNKFYIISKIRDITSETDEFNTHFREVLNSLVF